MGAQEAAESGLKGQGPAVPDLVMAPSAKSLKKKKKDKSKKDKKGKKKKKKKGSSSSSSSSSSSGAKAKAKQPKILTAEEIEAERKRKALMADVLNSYKAINSAKEEVRSQQYMVPDGLFAIHKTGGR